MMNICKTLISLALVGLLAACGGGGEDDSATTTTPSDATTDADAQGAAGGPPATKLNYTDPAGTGWRLVRDSSSTDTRLVLNLIGPSGLTSRGVGFNLKKGTGVTFGKFGDGGYANNTGVFELKGSNSNYEPYAGTDADPVLFVSAPLKSGEVLSTGIFQKDRTRSPKDLTQPLLQVALELPTPQTGGSPGSLAAGLRRGQTVALSVIKARMVPADIGAMDFMLSPEAIAKARMVDISIEVGALRAQ